MSDAVESWLLGLVGYYRPFGFFGAYRELEDKDLVEVLIALEEEAGGVFDPQDFTADLQALRWDEIRVWTEDPDQTILPEKRVYETTLKQWSSISRGAFAPAAIKERWDGPQGPIWVEFLIEEFPYTLEALHSPNLIDVEILKEVNQLLIHPYYRFELCEGSDQLVSVMMLTPEERVQIERERGLVFHIHDLAHLFEAASLFLLDLPEVKPNRFLGTLKEAFERSVGKLALELKEGKVQGTYESSASDYDWKLELQGEVEVDNEETFVGPIRGRIHGVPFEGVWKAGLSDGDRFLYGSWIGRDEKGQEYSGTFGGLEESTFRASEDAYVGALKGWLEEVWEAPRLLQAPLTILGK